MVHIVYCDNKENILEKIAKLCDKDNKETYNILLELEQNTKNNNELYNYFEELLSMLKSDKSVIRIRGFRLICHLSKWDEDNKIKQNINTILKELDDEISTNIRQCLNKLYLIIKYKPELKTIIMNKINNLDLTKYKESMQSLIKKDIKKLIDSTLSV